MVNYFCGFIRCISENTLNQLMAKKKKKHKTRHLSLLLLKPICGIYFVDE